MAFGTADRTVDIAEQSVDGEIRRMVKEGRVFSAIWVTGLAALVVVGEIDQWVVDDFCFRLFMAAHAISLREIH